MSLTVSIILGLLFIAYAVFAYRYARHSPWDATWQGITLEAQKLTMAALVGFFLVDTIVQGPWPGRVPVLILLLFLLLVEAWATLIGLLHVQRAHRPVSRRQGTGYALPEDIERTKPPRRD